MIKMIEKMTRKKQIGNYDKFLAFSLFGND